MIRRSTTFPASLLSVNVHNGEFPKSALHNQWSQSLYHWPVAYRLVLGHDGWLCCLAAIVVSIHQKPSCHDTPTVYRQHTWPAIFGDGIDCAARRSLDENCSSLARLRRDCS